MPIPARGLLSTQSQAPQQRVAGRQEAVERKEAQNGDMTKKNFLTVMTTKPWDQAQGDLVFSTLGGFQG